MKKLLLTLLLLFTLGLAAKAQGSADLATMNGGKINTSNYGTYTTTNGWKTTYALVHNIKITPQAVYPVLDGKTTAIGTLTSPALTGGVGTVSIKCVYPFSEKNGMKFTLNIKQNGAVVKTQTFTSTSNATADFTSDAFNVAGDFVIEIKAGSPSNNTGHKDRLGIYELTWTGYTAGGNEKITLDAANIEVKAGEEAIESEKELDTNTKVTFSYNTDNTNADISYSYSVDGGEEVEGNEYTFTGEKDVELTVKATSTNTVSKTVKLLKKYPTVCPEPIFSVENGAKVYAGQAVTVSCEGAEIEWTVNDVAITGTSYTITEAVGTQLTFKATASVEGRDGKITSNKEITVTVDEATEATFNFNEKNYGLTRFTAGSDYEPTLTEISEGIVKINFTGNFRLWGASAGDQLRVMSGATFTISVPEDYYIESITFDGSTSKATPDKGSISNSVWSYNGFVSAVKFTCSGRVDINKATIKYAKITPILDGDPTINVTHASKKGVLIVEYSFKIANHNGKPVAVTATIDGKEHITFADATPANVPARVAGESTTFSGTLRAEHADLVDATNLNVNLKATLDGQEFFTRQATVNTTTGIEDVTVESEAEAEYYNLQGLRVAQPEAGQLYIKRQGSKTVKVRF